jgi:hypothetical protein
MDGTPQIPIQKSRFQHEKTGNKNIKKQACDRTVRELIQPEVQVTAKKPMLNQSLTSKLKISSVKKWKSANGRK